MKTTKTKTKSITIIGRRWFTTTYGNTYFSAEIYVNGKHVHKINCEYGYESMYLQSAFYWLDENGYTNRERNLNGMFKPIWRYCKENGIELVNSVTDVSRKRDL